MVVGTTLTPYGLTSPFFGTVEAIVLIVLNGPMNIEALLATAGQPAIIALTRSAVTVSSLFGTIVQRSVMTHMPGACFEHTPRKNPRQATPSWTRQFRTKVPYGSRTLV